MSIHPVKVGVVLIDNFALLSYASFIEPLRASNLLSGENLFEVSHYSVGALTIRSSSRASIETAPIKTATQDFDYLFVVAGGTPGTFYDPVLFATLQELSSHNLIIGGISGGPVILVKAGLMNDYRMTVHWEHAAYLEQLNPNLLLEKSLFVIDRNRITCSGGTAPLDLMHYLITKEYGAQFASKVSDWFIQTVVRPPGETQRVSLTSRYGTRNRKVLAAIELIENHIADPLSLDQLAKLVGVSSRHLNRLFHHEVGESAMHLSLRIRLNLAYKLFAETSLIRAEIMEATGFSYQSQFSSAFKKQFGYPPSQMSRQSK